MSTLWSKLLLGTLLLIIFFFACKAENKKPDTKITAEVILENKVQLDSILNSYVDGGYYPFVYARIENLDGSVLYEHSRVNDEFLPNSTITKDSWIRIWSMSKIVTISIVLDLIEDGLLNFDDPVAKHIPEFKNLKVALTHDGKKLGDLAWGNRGDACPLQYVANDSIMTIRHLLTHKAGFYYANTGFACLDSMLAKKNVVRSKDQQEFINHLAELPLMQHSGDTYFYGLNTTVLGFVAERAAGKNLKDLVVERITDPLKIKGLRYGLPKEGKLPPTFTGRDSILRLAKRGELDIMGPDVPDYDLEHELYLGGEGMIATADGYTDFLRMLLNHGTLNDTRFLDHSTVEDIYAPHAQLDNPYGHDGYNLWVSGDSMRINQQGDKGLWIGGGYESTQFWVDPKRDFVGVILTQNNEVRNPGYQMVSQFSSLLYQSIFKEE